MTPRTFTILGIVAVISVTAATLALGMRPQFLEFRADGERVFPSLLENADQVASFQVRQGNDQMTFVHSDKGWVLSESGGYAIDNRLAAKVILGLASLEFLEAKTKRGARAATSRAGPPEEAWPSKFSMTWRAVSIAVSFWRACWTSRDADPPPRLSN